MSGYDSGRIYAHTLMLNVAFFCVLFFMRGRSKRTFVLVPISSLLHLAEDGVWSEPASCSGGPCSVRRSRGSRSSGGMFSFFDPSSIPALWQEAVGPCCRSFGCSSSHGLLEP